MIKTVYALNRFLLCFDFSKTNKSDGEEKKTQKNVWNFQVKSNVYEKCIWGSTTRHTDYKIIQISRWIQQMHMLNSLFKSKFKKMIVAPIYMIMMIYIFSIHCQKRDSEQFRFILFYFIFRKINLLQRKFIWLYLNLFVFECTCQLVESAVSSSKCQG